MTDWSELCPKCMNYQVCIYLKRNRIRRDNAFCPGLAAYLDNNTPLREPLTGDIIHEQYEQFVSRDYKEVLGSLCAGKIEFTDEALAIISVMPDRTANDLRVKAICSMLFFGLSRDQIMRVLGVAERTFYRILKRKSPSE